MFKKFFVLFILSRKDGVFKMNTEQRNFYSVKEVRQLVFNGLLSIGTLHKKIADGEIPAIALCKKRLIPASWVEAQIASARGEVNVNA